MVKKIGQLWLNGGVVATPDLKNFFMDRCPKDEPTGKNLVCKKALPISEKNWKNLLGGGIHPSPPPLGHWRVKF